MGWRQKNDWVCPVCGSSKSILTNGNVEPLYPFTFECGICKYQVVINNEEEEIKILTKNSSNVNI